MKCLVEEVAGLEVKNKAGLEDWYQGDNQVEVTSLRAKLVQTCTRYRQILSPKMREA